MALFDISLPGEQEWTIPVAAGLTAVVGLGPHRKALLRDAIARWAAGDAAALTVTNPAGPLPSRAVGDAAEQVIVEAAALASLGRSPSGSAAGAVGAHAAAAASLDALDDVLDVLDTRVADAAAARAAAMHAIERAAGDVDPEAPGAVTRLRAELGPHRGGGWDERRRQRLTALTEAATTLASADPRPVAAALDALRRVRSTDAVASCEAALLADEWSSLRRQLEVVERRLASGGADLERAGRELDEARARLGRAEDAARRPSMSPEEARQLEAAHEAVLDAERKASSRLGGARARRALEVAMAAEREILDRHGYPTWSAWVMGDRLLDATSKAKREAALARRDVARAEATWAEVLATLDADAAFAELMSRLDDLYERSVALVGEHDDLEPVLRRATVGGGALSADAAEAGARAARLQGALVAAGIDIDVDASPGELIAAAERWLTAVAPLVRHRHLLEEARCHAEADEALVARLQGALAATDPDDASARDRPGIARREDVSGARTATAGDGTDGGDGHEAVAVATAVPGLRRAALVRRLQDAEARREDHETALLELTERWCEALAAGQVEAGAAAEREAKRGLWDLSHGLEAGAAARLGPAEALAATIAARARLVRRDGLAPLVVLDDAFASHPAPVVRAAVAHLRARRPRTPVVWLLEGELPEGLEAGPGLAVVAAPAG